MRLVARIIRKPRRRWRIRPARRLPGNPDPRRPRHRPMPVTESALLDALQIRRRPEHRQATSSRPAGQEPARRRRGDVAFEVELGYPAKSQLDALRRSLVTAARGVDGVGNVSVNVTTRIVAHSVQRGVQLLAEREEHRRRRLGQGRRRQEHHRRQPGAGARRRGRLGRHPRRRHLRPEPADDARRHRPARDRRRQDDGAAGRARPPGDVDRLPGRARPGDGLARPDGHAGARPAAAADALAASSTT